jgi:Leucine-rich repeat (LRR) protein
MTQHENNGWMQELWNWADEHGISAKKLPREKEALINLTALYLYENELTSLPESIGNLTNLTKIILTENELTSLPESIGNFTNLTTLDLRNALLTIP